MMHMMSETEARTWLNFGNHTKITADIYSTLLFWFVNLDKYLRKHLHGLPVKKATN